MNQRLISIPAFLHVYVDEDAELDEDTLFDAVIEHYGKYPTIDARDLNFEDAMDLGV